jgi:protoheme IX farnesyltransferase
MPYKRITQNVKPYLALCRIYIALFAACAAATGFSLAPHHRVFGIPVVAAAVFFLACGASALNQCQERDIDAKMARTRRRPLPSGAVILIHALSVSLSLMLAGILLLAYSGGMIAAVLGCLAVLWYNGLYTYLKRVTAFASVPGAVVGMIPSAIGWVSAGGNILDVRLAAVCFVFFMWQIPHFWLLLLHHGEEYEKIGLPSLVSVMNKGQIARITFIWIFAAAVASLLLPLYGSVQSAPVYYSFIPLAAWLVWNGRFLAARHPLISPSYALFRKINVYLFLVMSLITLENIFSNVP